MDKFMEFIQTNTWLRWEDVVMNLNNVLESELSNENWVFNNIRIIVTFTNRQGDYRVLNSNEYMNPINYTNLTFDIVDLFDKLFTEYGILEDSYSIIGIDCLLLNKGSIMGVHKVESDLQETKMIQELNAPQVEQELIFENDNEKKKYQSRMRMRKMRSLRKETKFAKKMIKKKNENDSTKGVNNDYDIIDKSVIGNVDFKVNNKYKDGKLNKNGKTFVIKGLIKTNVRKQKKSKQKVKKHIIYKKSKKYKKNDFLENQQEFNIQKNINLLKQVVGIEHEKFKYPYINLSNNRIKQLKKKIKSLVNEKKKLEKLTNKNISAEELRVVSSAMVSIGQKDKNKDDEFMQNLHEFYKIKGYELIGYENLTNIQKTNDNLRIQNVNNLDIASENRMREIQERLRKVEEENDRYKKILDEIEKLRENENMTNIEKIRKLNSELNVRENYIKNTNDIIKENKNLKDMVEEYKKETQKLLEEKKENVDNVLSYIDNEMRDNMFNIEKQNITFLKEKYNELYNEAKNENLDIDIFENLLIQESKEINEIEDEISNLTKDYINLTKQLKADQNNNNIKLKKKEIVIRGEELQQKLNNKMEWVKNLREEVEKKKRENKIKTDNIISNLKNDVMILKNNLDLTIEKNSNVNNLLNEKVKQLSDLEIQKNKELERYMLLLNEKNVNESNYLYSLQNMNDNNNFLANQYNQNIIKLENDILALKSNYERMENEISKVENNIDDIITFDTMISNKNDINIIENPKIKKIISGIRNKISEKNNEINKKEEENKILINQLEIMRKKEEEKDNEVKVKIDEMVNNITNNEKEKKELRNKINQQITQLKKVEKLKRMIKKENNRLNENIEIERNKFKQEIIKRIEDEEKAIKEKEKHIKLIYESKMREERKILEDKFYKTIEKEKKDFFLSKEQELKNKYDALLENEKDFLKKEIELTEKKYIEQYENEKSKIKKDYDKKIEEEKKNFYAKEKENMENEIRNLYENLYNESIEELKAKEEKIRDEYKHLFEENEKKRQEDLDSMFIKKKKEFFESEKQKILEKAESKYNEMVSNNKKMYENKLEEVKSMYITMKNEDRKKMEEFYSNYEEELNKKYEKEKNKEIEELKIKHEKMIKEQNDKLHNEYLQKIENEQKNNNEIVSTLKQKYEKQIQDAKNNAIKEMLKSKLNNTTIENSMFSITSNAMDVDKKNDFDEIIDAINKKKSEEIEKIKNEYEEKLQIEKKKLENEFYKMHENDINEILKIENEKNEQYNDRVKFIKGKIKSNVVENENNKNILNKILKKRKDETNNLLYSINNFENKNLLNNVDLVDKKTRVEDNENALKTTEKFLEENKLKIENYKKENEKLEDGIEKLGDGNEIVTNLLKEKYNNNLNEIKRLVDNNEKRAKIINELVENNKNLRDQIASIELIKKYDENTINDLREKLEKSEKNLKEKRNVLKYFINENNRRERELKKLMNLKSKQIEDEIKASILELKTQNAILDDKIKQLEKYENTSFYHRSRNVFDYWDFDSDGIISEINKKMEEGWFWLPFKKLWDFLQGNRNKKSQKQLRFMSNLLNKYTNYTSVFEYDDQLKNIIKQDIEILLKNINIDDKDWDILMELFMSYKSTVYSEEKNTILENILKIIDNNGYSNGDVKKLIANEIEKPYDFMIENFNFLNDFTEMVNANRNDDRITSISFKNKIKKYYLRTRGINYNYKEKIKEYSDKLNEIHLSSLGSFFDEKKYAQEEYYKSIIEKESEFINNLNKEMEELIKLVDEFISNQISGIELGLENRNEMDIDDTKSIGSMKTKIESYLGIKRIKEDVLNEYENNNLGGNKKRNDNLNNSVTLPFKIFSSKNNKQDKKKPKDEEDDYDDDDVGGSYIEFPYDFSKKFKSSIMNPKNIHDNRCFYYCVNMWKKHKLGEKISQDVTLFNLSTFNWDGIDIENINFKSIEKFVSLNEGIKINIWDIKFEKNMDDDDSIKINAFIRYAFGYGENINIILYENHYMFIYNISKFKKTIENKKFANLYITCEHCSFYSTKSKKLMEKHTKSCPLNKNKKKYVYTLPSNLNCEFKNVQNKYKSEYIIYADFEAILEKCEIIKGENTKCISKHIPYCIGYLFLHNGKEVERNNFVGLDCSDMFLERIKEITKVINTTKKTKIAKSSCTNSYFVCDYCKEDGNIFYVYGKDRLHESCFKMIINCISNIKIVFHNFKNYDAHFLVSSIFKKYKNIFCIPKSKEKYTSLEYKINDVKVRFIDSRSFLPGSLDSLAKKLEKNVFSTEKRKLLFPYEYIDCMEKLYETELPCDFSNWYSSLKNETPEYGEILKTIEFYNEMNFNTILDYSVYYMMNDVLLLADIFEEFIYTCYDKYDLDPSHYFTIPGYSWDVAISKTREKIEIMSDEKMINLILDNIRGGISTCLEYKWGVADNNNSILYWDANNLYGWAMSQKLPYGNFEYCDIDFNGIINYDFENSDYGYWISFDGENPGDKILPFFPERINNKLCLSFKDKKDYFSHIVLLKQAIENGFILKNINTCIRFKHSYWLKDYIDMNTKLRSSTTFESQKNFYKLMNNAVFGKSMENVFKQCKYVPIEKGNEKKIKKLIDRSEYINHEEYTDDILMLELNKIPILNKPMYIGFSILEISKWKMYDFYYNCVIKKWPTCKTHYMDTDSIVITIPKNINNLEYNGYEDFFDLSKYDNHLKNDKNKNVLGKMKDEFPNDPIEEIICLKSKLYGLRTKSGKIVIKNKGCKTESMSFDDIRNNLTIGNYYSSNQISINSFKHEIFTTSVQKRVLPLDSDDKKINYYDNNMVRENDKYKTLVYS